MNALNIWQTALITSWGSVWGSFLGILGNVLGALIIFAIGLILAYWVKRLVVELLRLIKVDKISKDAGIDSFLKKADVKSTFVEIISVFFEWVVILIFFLAAVDILGLTAVSQVLLTILGYVPNIIGAAFILALGYLLAGVVGKLVQGSLASIDHDIAKPLGEITRWLLLVVAIVAAVGQLQIAQGFVQVFFQGLTYTIVLAVGLSIGLGGKDLVGRVLNDWYDKVKKK